MASSKIPQEVFAAEENNEEAHALSRASMDTIPVAEFGTFGTSSTASWFARGSGTRQQAIEQLNKVRFIRASGEGIVGNPAKQLHSIQS